MAEVIKVNAIAVQELDPEEEFPEGIPTTENGIISSRFYKMEEIPHSVLEMLFEQNPEYVMKNRPDWIKEHHPELLN